jgi:predicted DNA-binding transcriptional regulator AlpA
LAPRFAARPEVIPMKCYNLDDWLKLRSISRPHWYKLVKDGRAPNFFYVGRRVKITEQADTEWLQARMQEAA